MPAAADGCTGRKMEAGWEGPRRGTLIFAIAIAAVAVLLPALAIAHIERASYWPDPAPDTHVKPAAGGKVPAVRKLFSALNKKQPGTTRGLPAGAEQEAPQARQRQAALAGCDPTPGNSATSYRNRFYDNRMGQAPNGSAQPNGLDF
jgi:hypothetical protein